MNTSSDLKGSPEYMYAEAERTRKLAEQLAGLKMKPRQMWEETIATFLLLIALQALLDHLSLTTMDRILISVGFMTPLAALASRLYKSEKRVEALIQLLSKNGSLKS